MRRCSRIACLAVVALLLSSCRSTSTPEVGGPPPKDVNGTWSGDWGPSPADRNAVTLELTSDSGKLGGVVKSGPNTVTLTSASYNPDTGNVAMEADAQGRGGAAIHYTIEGKAEGNTMTGTWSHDDVRGDFKVTRN